MTMDFVQICRSWVAQQPAPTIAEFVTWLGEHCKVTPGDVMTDVEYDICCDLLGATPLEAEEALMETTWP